MTSSYLNPGPSREEIDQTKGTVVLEFGVDWCPHCKAAQPLADAVFSAAKDVTHIQVEDGKGKRLGRSFQVKLWPTFIFIKNGIETARVVRPVSETELSRALGH